MRKLSIIAFMSFLLAACGGDALTGQGTTTGSGSGSSGGTTGSTATSIGVTTDSASIPADGSALATITATLKDANNNLVTNATVSFKSSAGAIAVTSATTNAAGAATATLNGSGVANGTVITVTATSGSLTGTTTVTVGAATMTQQQLSLETSAAQVPSDGSKSATITAIVLDSNNNTVSGANVTFSASSGSITVTQGLTGANGQATATLSAGTDATNRTITVTAKQGSSTATVPVAVAGTTLTVTGPQNLVEPNTATYTVTLMGSGGVGISNQAVTVASAKGNTLSATHLTTSATGQATFTVTGTTGGTDTLTATALGMSATTTVAVSSQNFAITAPAANAMVNIGTSVPVSVTWSSGGAPVANQTVNFSSTRGTLSAATAMTNSQGVATVNISSTSSGPAVITANASGVSTQVQIDFLATAPTAINVQASPQTVSTNSQSTITAVVRDAANNLVENQLVNFALTDTTGGSLSVGSATTNSQGVAQTVYTASNTSSANNGVTIQATVQGTTVTGQTTLTVAGKAVFLSLGTGNKVDVPNESEYGVTYAVQAIDTAGNPVDNLTVDLQTTSVSYQKGYFSFDTTANVWVPNYTVSPACTSEDVNNNGILDPGEDFNNNGKLDPGAVAAPTPGSVVTSKSTSTDANGNTIPEGAALFTVYYPKDHAYWVTVSLSATATVSGTQSSTSTTFLLPGLATDYTSPTVSPPGFISPYGQANTCGDPN